MDERRETSRAFGLLLRGPFWRCSSLSLLGSALFDACFRNADLSGDASENGECKGRSLR
jgi:hypothetical protein